MALPDEPTADQLAVFLRSNDATSSELNFVSSWYDGMEAWSDQELRDVSEAALTNDSIRDLLIDAATLSIRSAGAIARIISNFRLVRQIRVYDSQWENPDVPMADPHVVDAVLYGIMASQSNVEGLRMYGCCSPRLFREFIERFPSLENLGIEGTCSRVAASLEEFDDVAVAIAACIGKLPTLRRLGLCGHVGSAAFGRLLSSVNKTSPVMSIRLNLFNHSRGLLKDAFLFCTSEFTKTVNQVSVFLENPQAGQFLDILPLFPIDAPEPFSPSIQVVHFFYCEASNVDDLWLNRAATAMSNVECLSFGKCHFPRAFDLLERLTRLTEFRCFSRAVAVQSTDTLEEEEEVDDAPYMLGTNEALERFCQVAERKDSMLHQVALDVVSVDEAIHFPAISTLLRISKGQLIVNFGKLPHLSSFHVAKGTTCLSHHLRELRIRFCQCEFGDSDFAAFIRAFGSNKSLEVFEFGFDTHANLNVPTASISAIRRVIKRNDTLRELAVRGLGSGALTALLERVVPALATQNRSLRALDLYGSDLSDVWTRHSEPLLGMLNSNGVLARLGGDFPLPEDDPAALQVQRLLKHNGYGRHLVLLRDPPAPRGLWPTVFARIAKDKKHDVMFAFLRATVDLLLPNSAPPGRGDPPSDNDPPRVVGRKRSRSVG
jgi:hypothetical protein